MLGFERRLALCGATLAVGLGLAPGVAEASTVLGETSGTVFAETCSGGVYTEVQVSTGAAPSYTVPAGGGVITSFSHQGGPAEAGDLKLKVYRPTVDPDEYTVVGSAQMTMGADQLTTAPADIPVQAGDTLGYTRLAGSTMRCLFSTANATDVVRDLPGADTADLGTSIFGAPAGNLRINISAVLEADADGDGSSDETGDNCLGVANPSQANGDGDALGDACDGCPLVVGVPSNNGCPAPAVTPTPTTSPPPAKKKCKKAKKGAGAAKKCKRRKG